MINLLIFSENLEYYGNYLFTLIGYAAAINIINWFFLGSMLNILGIRPRTIGGLPGIICAPVLHGDFQHLIFNAIPFFSLSLMMIAFAGISDYYDLLIIISITSGVGIWLFGRRATHIGASALVTGLYGWLLSLTAQNPTPFNIFVMVILLFYFTSILVGLFPSKEDVSWEGHLIGFLSGLLISYYSLYFFSIYDSVCDLFL